jgi:hypothetical protein
MSSFRIQKLDKLQDTPYLCIMSLAIKIRNRVSELAEGVSFRYADLDIDKTEYQSAAKVLERMQAKDLIRKTTKGVFYKPKQSVFGEIAPNYRDQLRLYLFKNGKRIGYETGVSLYNKMGLTTQMAFQIKIASRSKRIFINRGALKATAVKSYAEVTDENYELLGLLDAIKDIKAIPDCSITKAVAIISSKIQSLSDSQLNELIQYALLYPSRVRALLGAILENSNNYPKANTLKESLNPLTKIKLGIIETDLPTIKNWNIL